MKKLITVILITLTVLTISLSPPAFAADTINGAQVFSVHCAACHSNGGNIVRRGKNLKQKALKRYGVDSLDAIDYLVANGKNNMPAFKDRLSDQQIEDVAAYVLEQAEKGWR